MCYHDSQDFDYFDIVNYYKSARFSSVLEEMMSVRRYHVNGFDHVHSPVFKTDGEVVPMQWGLIPGWTKSWTEALQMRTRTLNCISEEAYDKPSYRDSLKTGKRCLIPITGFFEWRWADARGKNKYPYYIRVKEQKIFSLAGIYASWVNKETGEELLTYSVLTTKANPLMEKIHNSKKRMPVIIPREMEQDWLNPQLAKDDVLAFCQPYDQAKMEAYTIGKLITSRSVDPNQPGVYARVEYPELALLDG